MKQRRGTTLKKKKIKRTSHEYPFLIKTTTLENIFFSFLARKLSSCFYSSVRKLNAPFLTTKLSVRNKHFISALPSFTNSNQCQVTGTGTATNSGMWSLNVPEL